MKKIFALSLIALLLVSCQGNSTINPSTPSDTSGSVSDPSEVSTSTIDIVTEKEGVLYTTKAVEKQTLTQSYIDYEVEEVGRIKYINDKELGENRAYVSITSFLDDYYIENAVFTSYETNFQNNVFTYTFNTNDYLAFDLEKYTITSNNLARIGSRGLEYPADISKAGVLPNTHIQFDEVLTNTFETVTLDMGSHNLKFIYVNSSIYLPTTILGLLFLYCEFSSLAFNGLNFYLVSDPSQLISSVEGLEASFYQSFYGTSTMSNLDTKTQAEANHDADIFLFTLDYFYGFIEDRQMSNGYGSYLKENYPDIYSGLYSTDIETVLDSYDFIIKTDMGDGHSMLYSESINAVNLGSFYKNGVHTSSAKASKRSSSLSSSYMDFVSSRLETLNLESISNLGDKYLEFSASGETAIIRFDSFLNAFVASNQDPSTYEEYVSSDNFSLFYTCYKKIKEKGTVKNIVVDLTCNGGGLVLSLIAILGFIVENPSICLYDRASKTSFESTYLIDTNADGVFDENESPAKDYTSYVLTSPYSFSCANAYPYYAKVSGVKTMGMKSGGGSNIVFPIVLPDGYSIRISSSVSLGKKSASDEGIDGGIPVDIEVPVVDLEYKDSYENFYKIDYLENLIKQDQSSVNS